MIDLVCIFTTGGIVLFYQAYSQSVKQEIIQKLIQNNIAKEKDEQSILIDSFRVQYIKSAEHNLIFTVATQDFLKIQKIDILLSALKSIYLDNFIDQLIIQNNIIQSIPDFKQSFENVVNAWNQKNILEAKKEKTAKTFYQTKKGKEALKTTQQGKEEQQKQADKQKENQKLKNQQSIDNDESGSNENIDENLTEEQLEVQRQRSKLFGKKNSLVKSQSSTENPELQQSGEKKPKKVMRESTSGKITKRAMENLDKSSAKQSEEDLSKMDVYLGGENDVIQGYYDSGDDTDEEQKEKELKKGFFSKISNSIKVMTGNKIIDEQDLEPVLESFKDHLAGKNVAEEMAAKIVESIKINMLKTKSIAFTSINKVVKEALESTLTKVLTPKKHIDPIAEALRARERGKPYVMTFIGVNGVGKSTNLAKIAYMFKSQGFKIMLAACDNFRAGAVEQIKTHGRCLDVPVFDRGYGKDAADIAFEAIREATLKKYEVVLIDTAGRMQDNEPLMRQLSKLVVLNNPDLIVFIGEALVGNDGLDQLNKFNKALIDLSPRDNIREIDGVILSKFDTVDDKVGAAITMTYNSGKPILFVGVGQKYTHLKKLNVKTVVHSLLA